jgi:glycine cleavage system H protein
VVRLQDHDFPDALLYDIDNQIWYEPLGDGSVRAGFTSWAVKLMGEVLVFTPKRIGRAFEKGRSFALVEGGKWVGSARAAFDDVVVAHNDVLIDKPEILNQDAYGQGWMLTVRPALPGWRDGLVTGAAIGPAFHAWMATSAYKDRTE